MINKFDGRYFFLSNFAISKITHKGITYPTVEHYYVAMKIDKPQWMEGVDKKYRWYDVASAVK